MELGLLAVAQRGYVAFMKGLLLCNISSYIFCNPPCFQWSKNIGTYMVYLVTQWYTSKECVPP